MKNRNKILSVIAGGFAMVVAFSSCVKNKLPLETDFSNLQDHVIIVKSGLTNFSNTNVGFNGADTATVTLIVNLASVNLPSSPLKVTLGVDTTLIAPYNAANSTNFQALPAGDYTIASTSLTIPAGQQYAQTTVSFYAANLDPAVSYLLPVSIVDASGKALTSNLNTAYYNIIGNPIAGVYEMFWSRWNAADTSSGAGGAAAYQVDEGATTFSAVSPTEVAAQSLGTGEVDIIDFVNTNGTLSNFTGSWPGGDNAAYATSLGLASIGNITILTADPINGVYELTFPYVNGSGLPRVIKNIYIKQ